MSDDLQLLQRWREGDTSAGETLARTYYREIFTRIRRSVGGDSDLAADIAQQVFETASSNREDIVTDFRRYLHGVTRFKLWEWVRRQRTAGSEHEPEEAELVDPGHGAFSVMVEQQDARLLVRALRELSVEEQAYLMWAYADQLTHAEIAQRVGMQKTQIDGRIFRARTKLRSVLERLSQSPSQRGSIDKGFQTWMTSLRRRIDDDGER